MFQTLSLPVVLRFERIEVRAPERRVLVDGVEVKLGGRALDLLFVLLEHRERAMSKSELMDLVWPGLVVEENNLQVQMSHLRKVLGGSAISTIPGRGYRFTLQPDACATTEGGAAPVAPLGPMAVAASLIGRETELAELEAEIRAHALVSVVGAGGIGKTRLARAVLARLGPTFGSAWVRQRWLRKTGRPQEALESVLEQAALYREAGSEAAEMMAIGNVAHCELCLGRLADAEAHARAALERLDALGEPGRGAHTGCVFALALALQRKTPQALSAAVAAWPHLRAEGDEIRLLPAFALIAAQQGRWRQACRVIGCMEATSMRQGLVRAPAEFGEDLALERLLAHIPEDERAREMAAGAALDVHEAFVQASDPSASA